MAIASLVLFCTVDGCGKWLDYARTNTLLNQCLHCFSELRSKRGFLLRGKYALYFGRSRALLRGAVLTAIMLAIAHLKIELAQGNVAAAIDFTDSETRAPSLAFAFQIALCNFSERRSCSRCKYS